MTTTIGRNSQSPQTRADAEAPTKAARLKQMLLAPELAFIMEAHNGLSAKIVEEAGFSGIWASGLAMSAALGVRDNNEASWTQVLEQLEFMADATSIPILVDGDTGYGNFNNVRRLVAKLCQRGIAGVCIEDKLFPKTNSFIGEGQPLADIDEFCGRIKAGKDTQTDPDFCLVARVEALISGWPMEEALQRAEAYHEAGADAILIHSKKSAADEIVEFANQWGGKAPVVIVPTMYYRTPTDAFRDAAISLIIWANHNMRASISAMRETSRRIMADQSLVGIEDNVVSVKDVFSLVGQSELAAAERRYFTAPDAGTKAIVLAASQGSKLGPLTAERPKCMVDVRGQPLLRRLVSTLNGSGINDVSVVCGYKPDTVDLPKIDKIDNLNFENTGEAASLACAADRLEGPCLLSYGDILFRPYILDALLGTDGDIVCAVDARWQGAGHRDPARAIDAVQCAERFTGSYLEEDTVAITGFADSPSSGQIDGEFIGLVKLSGQGATLVRDELNAMHEDGTLATADLPMLLQRLVDKGVAVSALYVTGHWLDVDDALDLARMRNMV